LAISDATYYTWRKNYGKMKLGSAQAAQTIGKGKLSAEEVGC